MHQSYYLFPESNKNRFGNLPGFLKKDFMPHAPPGLTAGA